MSFSDYQIFQELIKGKEEDSFFKNSVSQMLRIVMEEGCHTQKQVLDYLGERFRVKLSLPDWYPNAEAAEFLFKYVCFRGERGGRGSCLGSEPGGKVVLSRKEALFLCSAIIPDRHQCPCKTIVTSADILLRLQCSLCLYIHAHFLSVPLKVVGPYFLVTMALYYINTVLKEHGSRPPWWEPSN